MSHPQSPHRSASADPSGGLCAAHHPKDVSRAPLPQHSQSSLPSASSGLSLEVPPMATVIHESVPSSEHHGLPTVMGLNEPGPMQWPTPSDFPTNLMGQDGTGYHVPVPFTPDSGDFVRYAQNSMSYNDNYNLAYSAQYPSSSCPRSYNDVDLTGLPNISMSESYPPTAYQIEPQRHHDIMDMSDPEIDGQLMQLHNDYEHHHYDASQTKAEDRSDYQSPYSDFSRESTPQDDLRSYPHDHSAREDGVIDKEQPYAQLIYQALLQAKDHTMILRDIYDWFRVNTDKASASETKGWQNSIRHNLSMNGAFEKVDQPGEDARKGFMWKLTDEAIRDGVKSTTRYRSKQPNKRGHRNQQPQPQRQASGAKGGHASRRSARMKRSNRMDPYIARSVPASFDPNFNGICGEAKMPYPPSPSYGSEVDFGYSSNNDDFGSPSMGAGVNLFPHAQGYMGSVMSQGMPITDTAFVLDRSPDLGLFTNSPSPDSDSPRTPDDLKGWGEDVSMGPPYVWDEMGYQQYAG